MSPADQLTRWLAQLRNSGRAAVLSRLLIGVAGLVAMLLPGSRPWDQLDLVPVLALPLLCAALVLPDSTAPLLFVVVVSGGWLLRAPSGVGWDVVVTGIALLVVHLGSAFAAQLPSYARVDRRALRSWLLPATTAVALGPVVAVAATLAKGLDGSLALTIGALAAATAAVWFAAGQSVSDRNDES